MAQLSAVSNNKMSVIMEKLIPDFREIVEIFKGMLAQHTEDTAHIEDTTKT